MKEAGRVKQREAARQLDKERKREREREKKKKTRQRDNTQARVFLVGNYTDRTNGTDRRDTDKTEPARAASKRQGATAV